MFTAFVIFQKSFKLFIPFVVLIMNKTMTCFSYWHKMNGQVRDHYFDSSFTCLLFTQFQKILFHIDLKSKIEIYKIVFICLTHLLIYFVFDEIKHLFICFFFEWYLIFELYLFNSKIHCTWCSFSFFIVKKYSKVLWSIIIPNFYIFFNLEFYFFKYWLTINIFFYVFCNYIQQINSF